jgi:hypothetical protein
MQVNNLPNLSVAAPRSAGKISSQSISGGKTLGSGIVDSAANNIVGFKKAGTSAVAPKVPNISSLLQTISSNIISSVENITGNVKNVIQGGITNVKNVFGKKEREEDPNKIMSEFLGLYKKALDYVKFFADPKQLRGFDKAIKLYQDSLKSTGDTVVTIRKFIKKMIKDFLKLKNELSSMGGGGGGFALPLPIPGRRNKPSPRPRTRTRVPRGGRGKLGLGLLGLGLLGGGAMAAQKFIGGNEEKRQTATGISGEIVAKFDSVLQKFDEAVTNLESLISGSGEKGDGKDKKGGGGSGGFRSGVGNVDAATIKADTAEKKAFIATVREAEGTSGEQGYNTVYGGAVVPELTQMTLGELHEATKLGGTDRLPERLGGGVIPFKKDKHNSSASGALQLMPNTLMGLMNSDNFDKDTIFTPEVQNQMILQLAAERGIDVQNMDVSQMRKAGGIWAGLTPQYNQTTRTASDSMKLYDDNLIEARKTTSSPYSVPEGQMGPVIEPKPDKVSSLTPQSATYVSQVPGSNSVTIIPMGGGDSGPQERTSPPPPVQVGSSENHINFNLSPEDSDNIHPMHTKATLNIC